MNTQIKELAEARDALATARENLKTLEAELLANPVYVQLKETTATIADTVSQMEESVRAAGLESFKADGNKKPHPAVSIKIFQVVEIGDEAAAREWCFDNFRPALKLDAKTFEKAAKDGNVPNALASVTDDPRAQIATDLSAYVKQK